MTQVEISPETLRKVKEVIVTVYELTNTEEGYRGSMHTSGTRFSLIVTILTKRGILIKGGSPTSPVYKWFNPAQAPTKNLYKSVGSELVLKERSYGKKCYQNKRKKQEGSSKTEEAPAQVEAVVSDSRSLDMYSVQELWDELKRRGCYIEDNKLAVKTIQFFA